MIIACVHCSRPNSNEPRENERTKNDVISEHTQINVNSRERHSISREHDCRERSTAAELCRTAGNTAEHRRTHPNNGELVRTCVSQATVRRQSHDGHSTILTKGRPGSV